MNLTERLRWAADVLDGLPGIAPLVSVTVEHRRSGDVEVLLHVHSGSDELNRAAVDMIAAVTGCDHAQDMEVSDRGLHYGADGDGVRVFAAMSPRYVADWLDRRDGAVA